jgi:TIR domain/Domain of unknown function (DUF4062)
MPSSLLTVRIFLCTTFRDMQAEREILHSLAFPKISEWFARHGVTVQVVDLGWRSTEDHAEGAKELKRSLDEMEQCLPFFVGLVGQRYGRGLQTVNIEAVRAYPRLRKVVSGTSRMHLEMLQGVLDKPERAIEAFFYLRRPDFLKQVNKDQCQLFLADTLQEENRLQKLLAVIKKSGRPAKEYSCSWNTAQQKIVGLEAFGRLIVNDLERAIYHQCFPRTTFWPVLANLIFPQTPSAVEDENIFDDEEFLGTWHANPAEEADTDCSLRSSPLYVDENVQFTIYQPKVVQPNRWHDLLAVAHLSRKRHDAQEDEPDPLEQVETIVKGRLGPKQKDYEQLKQNSKHAVPHMGKITFIPQASGVTFNPAQRTFQWLESVHTEDFRFMTGPELDGKTVRGQLTVYLGAIILAEVPLAFHIDSRYKQTMTKEALQPCSAKPFGKIFASYSHKDLAIVEQIEKYGKILGHEYLRDLKHLRAGEVWLDKLMRMIEEADVFQLFWSSNSMHSKFVKYEWEHALSLSRPNFIRLTYWEDPMPTSKVPPLPPPTLARLHFERIAVQLLPNREEPLPISGIDSVFVALESRVRIDEEEIDEAAPEKTEPSLEFDELLDDSADGEVAGEAEEEAALADEEEVFTKKPKTKYKSKPDLKRDACAKQGKTEKRIHALPLLLLSLLLLFMLVGGLFTLGFFTTDFFAIKIVPAGPAGK